MGKTIHSLPDNPKLIGSRNVDDNVREGYFFHDKFSNIGLGITSTLLVYNFDKQFEGSYSCQNGLQSEEVNHVVSLTSHRLRLFAVKLCLCVCLGQEMFLIEKREKKRKGVYSVLLELEACYSRFQRIAT